MTWTIRRRLTWASWAYPLTRRQQLGIGTHALAVVVRIAVVLRVVTFLAKHLTQTGQAAPSKLG
jgi:hypothetical protein